MRPSYLPGPLLLLLATAGWGAAPSPEEPVRPGTVGAGDVREGYERSDYRSRSSALAVGPGRRLDLAALAQSPPLGLPRPPTGLRAAAVDLGRALFFDRRLSANGTLSCGMCHVPEQGFTQNEVRTPVGLEGRSVRRNAPALYNVVYRSVLFHDGREATLETQIWSPLLADNEMGNPDRASVLMRVAALDDYRARFSAVYEAGLTEATLGKALASYQSGLLSADSPFDRFYFGGNREALGAPAQRGFKLFNDSGCASCHTMGERSARFTDDGFHNTGIGYRARQGPRQPARLQIAPGVFTDLSATVPLPKVTDDGRFEVTGAETDRDRFRTPGLRNVAVTAPYMHDGSLPSLDAVVAYYTAGGAGDPNQDRRVRPLNLSSSDKAALVAFLESLTGSNIDALAGDARSVAIGDHH